MRRLSEAEKVEIVAAYLRGERLAAIAARFGISEHYPGLLAARRGHPARQHKAKGGCFPISLPRLN